MRVFICDDIFPAMIDVLQGLLSQDEVRSCRQEAVEKEAPWAEVLIPSMTRVTSRIIDSAPDLKLIQQFGVGLEGVDIRAAAARGIPVANVPGNQAPVHAECTAEGGVFLMMACARLFKRTQKTLTRGEMGAAQGHGPHRSDRPHHRSWRRGQGPGAASYGFGNEGHGHRDVFPPRGWPRSWDLPWWRVRRSLIPSCPRPIL